MTNDLDQKENRVSEILQTNPLKWATVLISACTMVLALVVPFSPLAERSSQLEPANQEVQGGAQESSSPTITLMNLEKPLSDTVLDTTDKIVILNTSELQQRLAELKDTVELTGVGGYAISVDAEEAISAALLSIEEQGNSVGFVMVDITTGRGVTYNSGEDFYSASSIKGIYCTGFAANYPDEVPMQEEALYAMISYSDNDSYLWMRSFYGDEPLVLWCEAAGTESLGGDEWFPVCSPKTLTRLWLQNYLYFQSSSEISEQIATWYESTYNSALYNTLGNNYKVHSKGGWIADDDDGLYSTVDAGIVYAGENGERPYLLVIMSDIPNDMTKLEPLVVALDAAHGDSWGE